MINRASRGRTSEVPGAASKQPTRSRRALHSVLEHYWQLLFISLAFDPIIATYFPQYLSPSLALPLSCFAALAVLPFLAQSHLHNLLSSLRRAQKRSLHESNRTIVGALILLGALLASTKLMIAPQLPLGPAVIFLFVVAIAMAQTIFKVSTQLAADRERFRREPLAQVARWEEQLLVLSIVPLVIARSIGLCGALSAGRVSPSRTLSLVDAPSVISLWYDLPFLFSSAVFLAMLRPKREFFVGFCRRCKQPVPIVLVSLESCMRCDETLGHVLPATKTASTPIKKQSRSGKSGGHNPVESQRKA